MDWIARLDDIAASRGSTPEPERFAALMDADWQRTLDEYPESATAAGYPGDHGRWSDQSPEAHERRRRQASKVLEIAQGIDAGALDSDGRLNLLLFTQQAEVRSEGFRFPNERFAITPLSGPSQLVPRILSMTKDPADALARLEAVPGVVHETIALLREGIRTGVTLPRIVAANLAPSLEAFAATDVERGPLATSLTAVADDRDRRDAIETIRGELMPAFVELARMFREEYVPAARETIGLSALPDGEAWYAYQARLFTTTSLTPKEIHEIGRSEVARIRAEMETVKDATGFLGDFDAFFDHLRTDPRFFVATAEELLVRYRDIAKRADPKLAELFGVLPRTPYGVEPVPAHEQERAPTAYYVRGALQAGRSGTFHANTYELSSRPTWEMEALTLHEAVPGHHLQISIAQELGDVPEFRKHARFTAYVEGWGLYAESLGAEMGFYADPYSRFGQLTYEMWRAIRLVVDTGMHAFGWSREEAIDLFRRNAGKTDHDIAVEVDRYIAWPGQALAYKLGELTFKRLRARAAERLGDRFDVRSFHDEVLRHAALPLDVLESLVDSWIAERSG